MRAPLTILVIAALLATAPRPAVATGVPDPAHNLVPSYIVVVGTQGDVPDPNGRFHVVTRDVANNPVVNAQVIVDFGACTDMTLCPLAPAGQIVDCPTKTIRGFTDINGSITFDVVGAGKNLGAAPGPGSGCANITINSVSAIHPTVNVYDQNGAVATKGMEVTDLSAFLRDLGTGFYFGRSDYNQGNSLEVIDLSVFLTKMGTGYSSEGCTATYCP